MSAKLIGAGAGAVNSSDSAPEMISFPPIFSPLRQDVFNGVSDCICVRGIRKTLQRLNRGSINMYGMTLSARIEANQN